MLNIFLSDLHIGLNEPANWYQKTVHQKYLKAVLRYIQANSSQVQDVIMLGDWFEHCIYLPEGPVPVNSQEIFAANPEIFTPAQDGDFITCMDSIQGDLHFVNGNHDITVTSQDINNHFRPLSSKGKQVVCQGTPAENTIYEAESIYAEHGHRYSLISRPDNNSSNLYKPLSIDYYIGRTWASISTQWLQDIGQKNAAYLLNADDPKLSMQLLSLDDMLKPVKRRKILAQIILSSLVAIDTKGKKKAKNYFYTMPDGSRISAAEAAKMFPEFSIGKDNLSNLMVDINGSLSSVGAELCQQGYRVVIMGHTHIPKIELNLYRVGFGIYSGICINTGFLCPSVLNLKSRGNMTFAEVEQKGGKYYARLKKVDYPDTTISTIKEYSVDVQKPPVY